MPKLLLERLSIRDFRNLTRVDIEPASRLNVIAGNNGQGKTTLLEAIYLAATSRSFRTHRLGELVRHDAPAASVRARMSDSSVVREHQVAVQGTRATARLDGNKPASLSEFATRSPVVAFHPDELALSSGPANERRTLLDRIALFIDPASAEDRSRYAKAVRQRQQILHRGGGSDALALDAYEDLCAKHGARLTRARGAAARAISEHAHHAFSEIAAPDLTLTLRYAPRGSEDAAAALSELRRCRDRDSHRPSPSFGPHRDDLELSLDGHPARIVASQGQHRALTLALKAAEAAAVATARGLEPILLLDDVSSELDRDRTVALFRFLRAARGQIFLSTTRRELIDAPDLGPSERVDFRVERGSVERDETA